MNTKEATAILGLKAPFTAKEAKNSYHKLAMSRHPDKKGGSTKEMQKLNKAYELCKTGISFGKQEVKWSVSDGELFEVMHNMFNRQKQKPKPSINNVVRWFGNKMLDKLRMNSHKGVTWRSDNANELYSRLMDEIIELGDELLKPKTNKEAIIKECADVANFAMFIADKAERQL